MNYEDASLEAYEIRMLFEQGELRAAPAPGASSRAAFPVFKRGEGDAFSGRTLAYNLQTERGRVVGARTSTNAASASGLVEGNVVKMMEDSTLYIQEGLYTTCDCASSTPSYSLRSQRMKIADQKWVYTGPIQLYLFNIPMPLWLPFGFLPATEGRRSGPLPPTYGEDERGFYLQDWGWYFAMNDYTDLQFRFGLWSQGSWQASSRFRYDKRYNYGGNLFFQYTRNRRGEDEDPDFAANNQWRFNWNHSQTISPTSNFGGTVRFVSSSQQLRLDSDNFEDRVRQSISSNLRYSKRWPDGGRRFSASANQSQTFTDGTVNLTLPSLSFSQSSINPFERKERLPGRDKRWYERITTRYTGDLTNRYNFRPLDADTLRARGDTSAVGISWYEALLSQEKYRRATGNEERFDFQANHRVPLSVSFFLDRYRLNVSPNINYRSEWLIRTERKDVRFDTTQVTPDSVRVRTVVEDRSVPGFFARRELNASLSSNTTFYGTFPVGVGSFQGLRHTVRPSLSFSYQPNYNADFWGYTRTYETADGEQVRYDISTGRRVTRSTEQRSLGLSIGNVFETRRVRTDSTGETQSNTLQLLNANLATGYNFARDSLKLNDIRLRARTNIQNKYNISFNSTFSPYARDSLGNDIDRFRVLDTPLSPLRLTNLSLTLRTSFEGGTSSGGGGRQSRGRRPAQGNYGRDNIPRGASSRARGQGGAQPTRLTPYQNFSIPWRITMNLRYGLRRFGTRTNRDLRLNANFNFTLTPSWRVNGNTGYDAINRELTSTQIGITREFCCWVMNFSWYPFGQFQSYSFSLQLKSGPLRDLLRLNLPNADPRGRFGNVVSSGRPGF